MSKYVKDLVTQDLRRRLDGVEDAVLVNLIGLDANQSVTVRQRLREKDIQVLVVKNSLALRATEGSPLHAAFEGASGSLAVVWGSEDFVSLAKQIVELDKSDEFKAFEARGGVMDGEALSPDRVRDISKWPSREEQLSIISGQIIGVASQLSSQLIATAGELASQLKQFNEKKEEESPAEDPPAEEPKAEEPAAETPPADEAAQESQGEEPKEDGEDAAE